ncbi:diguanylate cyclase domain-containing protein [Aerosakkonemataceae cyanobacterium BLCC-F50]|uniref:Diguanylate cyclase domain-containing protein n=1 Tax=Floridaenema flaviceps BLCC-F50 TaxID=3153642 RepID=A0ABV4XZ51_9CYAN
MFNSFRLKLGLSIILLTVGINITSFYYFYSITSNLVKRQITEQLKAVGSNSTFLFSKKDREMIVKLKTEINKQAQFSRVDLQKLPPGGTMNSLTPENIRKFQSTKEFIRLSQIIRKILYASLNKVTPLKDFYPKPKYLAVPDSIVPYIMVPIPESPERKILKILVAPHPDPDGKNWPGNPIGNLYVSNDPVFALAFKTDEIQLTKNYYTDSFYTSLTSAVPIKDQQGQTIAILGLDYVVGSPQDEVRKLQHICVSIITISFIFSILLSLLLARHLGYPIKQLQIAAKKVHSQNYDVTVDIKRKDELGQLAEIFNSMVADIRSYATLLEKKVEQRTEELSIAKDKLELANLQLKLIANSDSLTQIANRRRFDDYLAIEWQRHRREKQPLSLILIDVDYFKKYNDHYGHQRGDDCLIRIAQTLVQVARRATDLVARYGGEEFAVILPNTNIEYALVIAENMRMTVEALTLPHIKSDVSQYVTLSLGVASFIATRENKLEDLIAQADNALYSAKNSGRNRCCPRSSEAVLGDHSDL